jgi:cation diffusion facilitator family transporter
MDGDRQKSAAKQIKRVTNISISINIILAASKMIVGLLSGSMAVVADGIHSLSDVVTDLAVLFGVHLGSKAPDPEHPYGHGRIETFAGGFIAVALVAVGFGMVYYAAVDIARGRVVVPTAAMTVVTVASIMLKEWLYRITKRVAVRTHSSATYANAWHHRSDALSSIAVLIGIVSLMFGFHYGDQVAAVAVGVMIVWVGVSVIWDTLQELTEGAVDPQTVKQIESIINANSGIRQWHQLRSRMVGREVFLDVHILVDPNLNIAAAHEISEWLENALRTQLTRPVNVVVHIEPDLPTERLADLPAQRK